MQLVIGRKSRIVSRTKTRFFVASNELIHKNKDWINNFDKIIFISYAREKGDTQELLVDLAKYLVRTVNKRIVFLSSDHVFNGKRGYYSVCDIAEPNTDYGLCKVELENIFFEHTVLRFTTTGPSQSDRPLMYEMALNNQIQTVYERHYFSPVSTAEINFFLNGAHIKSGIYHLVGDRLSKAAYLRQIGVNTSSILKFDYTFKDHSLLAGFK